MTKAQIKYKINNCYDTIDKNNSEIAKSLEWQEEILEVKRRLENVLSEFIEQKENSKIKANNMQEQ